MLGLSTLSMKFIWLGVAIIFGILEALTVGLLLIWFSFGAIAALIVSGFTDNLMIQIAVFGVVSVTLLVLVTKGIIKIDRKDQAYNMTNMDALIGKSGVCKVKIEKFTPGIVVTGGEQWSAKTSDGSEVEEGSEVKIVAVEGVKLVVKKLVNQ